MSSSLSQPTDTNHLKEAPPPRGKEGTTHPHQSCQVPLSLRSLLVARSLCVGEGGSVAGPVGAVLSLRARCAGCPSPRSRCCLLPRVGGKGGGIFGRCFNAACCPCQAPCCIHHCKPPPKRPLQPPRTCGKIIGCDCWCWHATCTWYPRCFPACLCCDEEEIDGSPATYFARTMFFPNEAIDIYDGQVDAWEDTNQDAPEEQKEAPDMERSA